MPTLKQKVVKGTFWALLERLSLQGTVFVVSLILARLLTPGDYGTVALLSIFITLSGVLADSGFGLALIQKKDATELDFNSVFYLSIALSSLFYAILFFSAPLIAAFYATPVLVPILRVSALTLVCNAINSVQNAELARKMLFHLSFRISLISSIGSAVVGISMAFAGCGPWALVGQTVSNGILGVIARWFIIAWRPKLMFSFTALKGLFRFGWKMAAVGFCDQAYNNLYGLLIGKFYSKADLAFVQKGQHVPQLGMETINATIARVAFPALAQLQDDPDRVRDALRKMLQMSTFFVFPVMVGCAICAKPLIRLLFGEQWLPSIPYLQLACFSYALMPFTTINLQAISAMGRSDIFLMLEIIKKVIGLAAVCISMRYGVFAMIATSAVVVGPLAVIVNAWPTARLARYSLWMQVRDVVPNFVIVLLTGAAVWAVGMPLSGWLVTVQGSALSLCVQVLVGTLVFVGGAVLLKPSAFRESVRLMIPLVRIVPRLSWLTERFSK